MPLARGPFALVADAAVSFPPGTYDFTDDALDLAARVQSNTSGWDDFLLDAGDFAADPLDDLVTFDADGLLQAVALTIAWSDLPNIDYALLGYDDANTQLGTAFAFAPSAAWEDPPGPFVPPGAVLNLTAPTVNINAFNPATTGVVGQTGGDTRPTAELRNLTRVGALNFVEGDTFNLLLLGNPGQVVTVGGTFNGANLDVTTMGVLDPFGNLGLQATMGPEVVGAWHEDWYFDGQLVKSFDFIVSAANA